MEGMYCISGEATMLIYWSRKYRQEKNDGIDIDEVPK
jgi:hypothetical protein